MSPAKILLKKRQNSLLGRSTEEFQYNKSSLIQRNWGGEVIRISEALRIQINGKFNYISSADENT
jgi:hypothetical protein